MSLRWRTFIFSSFLILLGTTLPSAVRAGCDPEEDLRKKPFTEVLENMVAPEIESKLNVPKKGIFRKLKKLIGTEIKLKGPDGKNVTFKIEMNIEHVYEDLNCDVYENGHLLLYEKHQIFRQRARWDKKGGKYKLAKVVTHAKDSPIEVEGLDNSIFVRNEIRGLESKDYGAARANLERILARDSSDPAVQFAYQLLGNSTGTLIPVLWIHSERIFMKVSKKGKSDPNVPSFHFSLDKVKYKGLVAAEKESTERVVENEIIDKLKELSPEAAKNQVYFLGQFESFLRSEYGLSASQTSKYESGVIQTILTDEE